MNLPAAVCQTVWSCHNAASASCTLSCRSTTEYVFQPWQLLGAALYAIVATQSRFDRQLESSQSSLLSRHMQQDLSALLQVDHMTKLMLDGGRDENGDKENREENRRETWAPGLAGKPHLYAQ